MVATIAFGAGEALLPRVTGVPGFATTRDRTDAGIAFERAVAVGVFCAKTGGRGNALPRRSGVVLRPVPRIGTPERPGMRSNAGALERGNKTRNDGSPF